LCYDRRPVKNEKYANNNYDPTSLSLNKSSNIPSKKAILSSTNKLNSKTKIANLNSTCNRPQTSNKFKTDNNFFPLEYR